jgi:beta-glucanase (GH16 family)
MIFCILFLSDVWAQEWKLVWSDEFDGTSLNDANWNTVDWPPGYVNGEEQRYVPGHDQTGKNIWLENGNLVIEARRETNGQVTSGRVNTQLKKSWKYGRFECRAKLPPGAGTWPAIWSMPDNNTYGGWPSCGEVDIMEFFGKVPDQVQFSIHCNKYNHTAGTQKHAYLNLAGVCTGYHVYAMEWYADSICGFADSTKYFTFKNEHTGWQAWPFDINFHWILNLAMGGANFGGTIASGTMPCRFYIDYVRVYTHQTVSTAPQQQKKPCGVCGIRQGTSGLEITFPSSAQYRAELAAVDGRVIACLRGHGSRALLDTRKCVPGVYLLRMQSSAGSGFTRVMLQ